MIRIDAFSELYNIKKHSIYTQISTGVIPSYVLTKQNKNTLIDEQFFARRKEFNRKIWLQSHKQFYFLNKTISTHSMSEIFSFLSERSQGTWNSFLSHGLWGLQSTSILNYKVNDMLWEFFRMSQAIIHRIFRKVGVKRYNRDLDLIWNV